MFRPRTEKHCFTRVVSSSSCRCQARNSLQQNVGWRILFAILTPSTELPHSLGSRVSWCKMAIFTIHIPSLHNGDILKMIKTGVKFPVFFLTEFSKLQIAQTISVPVCKARSLLYVPTFLWQVKGYRMLELPLIQIGSNLCQ